MIMKKDVQTPLGAFFIQFVVVSEANVAGPECPAVSEGGSKWSTGTD